MNSTDYVNQCVARQPKLFAAEKIEIKPKELKKQLKIAFEAGHAAGVSEKSIFEHVFGRED